MARTVLPIVGAIVGSFIPGVGTSIGFAVGSIVGNAVDPVVNKGPKIGETGAQTSAEGAPRAIVYGTASVTGNVIATGPMIETTSVETQGKGGPVNETSVAYRSYAIRICEGPIAGVLRVWQDDKLVYDIRPGSLIPQASTVWKSNKVFYLGDEAQLPDVFLQLNVSGVGETPAYRGSAYMVCGLEDLTDRRGSIYQYRFEVSMTDSGASIGTEWYDTVLYTGNGSSVDIQTLDLSVDGGMVLVTRLDAAEQPMIFYDTGNNTVMQMENRLVNSGGGPPQNPIISTAAVFATGGIEFTGAVNTSGGRYIAYVFKQSPGNFKITTYSGNNIGGHAVTHGLGATPKMHFTWPLDDPTYTVAWMHLEHFAGLTRLFFNDWTNYDPVGDISYWHNTPPNATSVTLGNHPQINGSSRNYLLFSFGGSDVYAGAEASDVQFNPGFDLDLMLVKQRDNTPLNFSTFSNATNANFAGADTAATMNRTGGVEAIADHIQRDGMGLYTIIASSAGSWVAKTFDVFAIRGAGYTPGAPITLGQIVADIHDRCGIPTAKLNRAELVDIVDGLVLAGDYTGGDAINTLRGPYFFDKTEYDRKLWYPKRGKPVVLVLDIDDLVEEPDTSRREQAVEFPKKLHLFYQHAASGYAAVKATSSRSSPDARVVGELSVQVPVVLDEDEAAQIAHKLHKIAWAEAEGEVVLSVPESFIGLVPSDNIGLILRGQVKRLRIEKMEYAAGVITLTMRHDRQSAYTSNVTGVPIPLPTPPPSTIVGSTTLAVLDIGARQDGEDDLHILVAGIGTAAGWYGWTLQRSLDGGANWTTVQSFSTAAVMGSLLDAVPAADEHTTDATNTVRVQLYRDAQTLEDMTAAQFLSEGGAFALEKSDGTWEVMQYRDAAEDSAGVFSLTMLHRGRLNSGAAAHVAGAKFVMLASASHIVMQSAWIGQAISYRAVSLSQSPELATVQTATYVGRSQLEWPVASLTLSRASNIVTASWAPRHRFGTDDAPVASINFTGYRVTIVGTSTVTFDQTAQSFSYDVSAIGGGVTVSVQALNRITGAGPATSGSV